MIFETGHVIEQNGVELIITSANFIEEGGTNNIVQYCTALTKEGILYTFKYETVANFIYDAEWVNTHALLHNWQLTESKPKNIDTIIPE